MWNGRWSKELAALYEVYDSIFGIEPDCQTGLNYDDMSYNTFKDSIKKSIVLRRPLQSVEG